MKVEIYLSEYKGQWDDFVRKSKNGTFLFYRDFMDYHSDRFKDSSLLFYKNDKLIALLPANLSNHTLYSHQGLTYGGLVMGKEIKAADVIKIFECLMEFSSEQGIKEIVYKSVPHIYHQSPAEEDLYALFLNNAQLVERNISSTILLSEAGRQYSQSRISGIKKAEKINICAKETSDFPAFWEILSTNLSKEHDTQPVHSLEEIELLKSRFPENIKLYGVYTPDNEMVGGEVVFDTATVCHAQYTAATPLGKKQGAIDLVIDHIIQKVSKDKKYFDYGISTENNGLHLNRGLIYHKEGFGARAIVYDIYSIKLS